MVRCPILDEVKREIERLKDEIKVLRAMIYKQCPKCGSRLEERELKHEKRIKCPKCDYLHVIFYREE